MSPRCRLIAAIVALSTLAAACSDDAGDSDASESADSETDQATGASDPTDETPSDTQIDATVSLEGLSGLTAQAVISADQPVAVQVTATAADHSVETPRTANAATEHSIPVVGMRADSDYEIEVVAYGESGEPVGEPVTATVRTDPLPEWMPNHEITVSEAASPGITLVETSPPTGEGGDPLYEDQPNQVLVAYDDQGEIVWYYTNSGAIGGVEQTDRGTFLSHYWPFGIRENDVLGNLVGHWRPQPADTSGETVDDEALEEAVDPDSVDMWLGALEGNPGDMDPLPVRADWIDLNGFHHENWPMPNGNILALSTTIHELSDEQRREFCPDDENDFNVISDVIVEYEPDGTVARTWDLWDVIDVNETPGTEMCVADEGDPFAEVSTRDWTHANSVVYDPEREAVIVSSRHTDQIVAFEYQEELGHQSTLRWIIGTDGTIPLDGEQTYHQHAVEVIDDGSLIAYDNGNHRPGTTGKNPEMPPYSRAVIFEVDDSSDDPADWSARQTWEHIVTDDGGSPVYASFISDADMLSNGNVLITHGGIGAFPPDPEDPLHALIIEVVPEGESGGEIVWEFRSDTTSPNTSYRSERIETFYVGEQWETS